jgi:hypothetical protein
MNEDNVVHLRPADDEVAELNRSHAVVLFGDKTAVMRQGKTPDGRPDLTFMPVDHFKNWMSNRSKLLTGPDGKSTQSMPLATYWLHHPQRRQFEGVVFRPEMEVPGYFNLWSGFVVEPRAGSCDRFLAHMHDNICRGDEPIFNWVMGFFADIFQNPGKKKDTSVALRGRQGVGKTKVAEVFGSLLGNHFVSASDPRYVVGRFNKHMLSCLLLCADEGFWAGDKTAEGKMRDLISGKRHPIELKGKEAQWVDNHVRLLVLGNADWVVPAAMDERRFCVLEVGEDHIKDHAYFAAIDEEMDNGGREALLDYLLKFDLSKVNLRKIPDTEALTDPKIASLSVNHAWWLDVLRRGELPNCENNTCLVQQLHESYVRRTDNSGRYRKSTETELGMFLHKMMPALRITRPRSDTNATRP